MRASCWKTKIHCLELVLNGQQRCIDVHIMFDKFCAEALCRLLIGYALVSSIHIITNYYFSPKRKQKEVITRFLTLITKKKVREAI